MANMDAGGGIEDRYSAKLFGLRFSPRTRLTVYGNLNNITDLSSPDGNGNWNSNVNPVGTIDRHSGGIDLLLQDKTPLRSFNPETCISVKNGILNRKNCM